MSGFSPRSSPPDPGPQSDTAACVSEDTQRPSLAHKGGKKHAGGNREAGGRDWGTERSCVLHNHRGARVCFNGTLQVSDRLTPASPHSLPAGPSGLL